MAGGLAELRGETPFIENYLGILDSRPVKYQGSIPVEKRDDKMCIRDRYFTVPTDMFSMWIKKFIRLRKKNNSSI